MMRIYLLIVAVIVLPALPVLAMPPGGCGAGDCRDCHHLSKKEAATLLKGKVREVVEVRPSQVPGLWDVEAIHKGRKLPLYIDFSKQYLISGNIIRLTSGENLTRQSFIKMNKVDIATIPLDDAIIIGNPAAYRKIIVFDDPECSYCRKLHPEMTEVVAKHGDIAFYVKMFPLPMHPTARDKAKTIVCAKLHNSNDKAKSLLADSLAGKKLPPPACDDSQVDKNILLAKKLNITSTPTLIMPDGRVLPGYKVAAKIVEALQTENP